MIELTVDGDRATVTITGDIDISHDEELHQALWEAVNVGSAEMVVNLAGVNVFGSAGVNALVWAWQELRDSSTVLQVCSPGPLTRRVLDLCELEKLDRLRIQPQADRAARLTDPMG